jgi:hypothetical protein
MRVETGDNIGIGGFIITGTVPKRVLVRVLGPSLAQFALSDVLDDPLLELHGPGTFATVTNNDWREDAAQRAQIEATGLAPSNDRESAIDITLAPGSYTALAYGKNNSFGFALIEVYDLSQSVAAKLANISTRASVGTGDNIVIAGFILGPQTARTGSWCVVWALVSLRPASRTLWQTQLWNFATRTADLSSRTMIGKTTRARLQSWVP